MLEAAPSSVEDLAQILHQSAAEEKSICAKGHGTKDALGGPIIPADILITTSRLCRVLKYEPRDLTISVEAGLSFSELQAILAKHGQMVALDPPSLPRATVGGVIATNVSGPMRLAFGTARDLVIGMGFATLNGHVVKAGGMVVKNVAGLDLGKLMIGSFGTLGVITSVNFRVHSLPAEARTFLFVFDSADRCIDKLKSVIKSKLRPQAIDMLSPGVSQPGNRPEYLLAIRAAGSAPVLDRYARELTPADEIRGAADMRVWEKLRNFTIGFLAANPEGIVLRISAPMGELERLIQVSPGPCLSRAATGVSYAHLSTRQEADLVWKAAEQHQWSAVVEYAPEQFRMQGPLWRIPDSGPAQSGFAMMKRLKASFDPKNLLNRSRLYGRI